MTTGMTTGTSLAGVDAEPATGVAGPVLRVVVVNGSPNERSKTMGLVDVVLDTLGRMLPIETSRIDVYRLGPGFTGATERDDVTPEVEAAIRLAENADLLISATPVFRGSYPGLFKHFFDLVDQYALANKLVLLAATGGTDRHALVLEHALRPLFAFFQALTCRSPSTRAPATSTARPCSTPVSTAESRWAWMTWRTCSRPARACERLREAPPPREPDDDRFLLGHLGDRRCRSDRVAPEAPARSAHARGARPVGARTGAAGNRSTCPTHRYATTRPVNAVIRRADADSEVP